MKMFRNKLIYLVFLVVLICLISLIVFSCPLLSTYAAVRPLDGTINLGLTGKLGYSGAIEGVTIYRSSYKTYALCGTQEGLLILDISKSPQRVAFLELGRIRALTCYHSEDGRDFALLLREPNDLVIIELTDLALTYGGRYELRGEAKNVAVFGHYACVADGSNGLVIIDLTDPARPVYLGGYHTAGEAEEVAIFNHYACVADSDSGLIIIDLSDPSEPVYTGGIPTQKLGNMWGSDAEDEYKQEVSGLAMYGQYACVSLRSHGLVVVDLANPAQPLPIGWYGTEGEALKLAVSGHYAYLADGSKGLIVIDLSRPANPIKVDAKGTGAIDIAVSDHYACVVHQWGNGLAILQKLPASPGTASHPALTLDEYSTVGYAQRVAISDSYAYLADKENGLLIVDVHDPAKPFLAGHYQGSVNDAAPFPFNPHACVVADGNRVCMIDLSDPNNPVRVGRYDTQDIAWSVKISGHYAYVANNEQGLLILDLGNMNQIDRADPAYVGSCDTAGYAHGLDVCGNYAYVADWSNGLVIMDITNPVEPVPVGRYYQPGLIADQVRVYENYAYVTAGCSGGLLLVEVSDPENPRLAAQYDPSEIYGAAYSGLSPGGVHDVAIVGHRAYLAAGKNGLVAVNVAKTVNATKVDIAEPVAVLTCGHQDTAGLASGVAISGNYAYVADAENGLIIFKIIDAATPQGNLILVPSGPGSATNSLWPASSALADLAWSDFLMDYPAYSMYYLTPTQKPDSSLIMNAPSVANLRYAITQWATSRLNTGPLYLYLPGQGSRDAYQIFPGEIIRAKSSDTHDNGDAAYGDIHTGDADNLKAYLDLFQKETSRDVICLLEFSSSGSFINQLIDSNTTARSLVSCTDSGMSYLDSDGHLSFSGQFLELLKSSHQTGLFAGPSPARVKLLEALFSQARQRFWALGSPWNSQPPQMVTARGAHTLCSISLKAALSRRYSANALRKDDEETPPASGVKSGAEPPPTSAITEPNQIITLKAIGHYLDETKELAGQIYYQSSDPSILLVTQEGKVYANPDTAYNGQAFILATIIDPNFGQAPLTCDQILATDAPPSSFVPPLGGVTGRIRIKVAIDSRRQKEDCPKAIIIAGRSNDPTGYDYLWESVNRVANHAYDTFINRGYSPENIYYLSHDLSQPGVDGPLNGQSFYQVLEDIFTNPNNLSLNGLSDLTIFLIDHGQKNKFILGPEDDQFLSPAILNQWLDTVQYSKYQNSHDISIETSSEASSTRIVGSSSPRVTVIIESCFSGCFLEPLLQGEQAEGPKRIVITSTGETNAYLAANGWVSFSYFFFNYLQGGASILNAFEKARGDIAAIGWEEHPLIGQNSHQDTETQLGGPFILSQGQPQIVQAGVSGQAVQPIQPHQPVELWARVKDLDGVDSVWALVSNSQAALHFSGSPEKPLMSAALPRVELAYNPASDRYQGLYEGFSYPGPYSLVFMAKDSTGLFSYPKTIHLNVEGQSLDYAFLVQDGPQDGENISGFIRWVLEQRRLPEKNIYTLSKVQDLSPALDSILSDLSVGSPRNLVICFVSTGHLASLSPDAARSLSSQLDRIQGDTTVITIIDAEQSGRFLSILKGPNRINISSAGPDNNNNNDISSAGPDNNNENHSKHLPRFSQFFFSAIYNGLDINQAFQAASLARGYYSTAYPLLDDNGNGLGSEYGSNYDGRLAAITYLGSPFDALRAGPRLSLPAVVRVNGWQSSSATVWATVQDPNSRLLALIIPPDSRGEAESRLVLNYDPNQQRFEADYHGFTSQGVYRVAVYAEDQHGLLDYDESPYLVLWPDEFEPDNDSGQAGAWSGPLAVNQAPQRHSFHQPDDEDWACFYAYAGLPYEVSATKTWSNCPLSVEVYAPDGTLIRHSASTAVIPVAPENGFYLVHVSYTCPVLPDDYPWYDLSVVCPLAVGMGGIWGWVRDADTGEGIVGAKICNPSGQCVTSMEKWQSDDPALPSSCLEKGFYFLDNLLDRSAGVTITAQAEGYLPKSSIITGLNENISKVSFYLSRDSSNIYTPVVDDPLSASRTAGLLRGEKPDIKVYLDKGLNLFSHPAADPGSYYDVWDFLQTYGYFDQATSGPSFFGLRKYTSDTDGCSCYFVSPPQAAGQSGPWPIACTSHFPIVSGEGYAIYMLRGKTLDFPMPIPNPPLDLKKGPNWIGVPSPSFNYTAYLMLQDIGREDAASITGFDPVTGRWKTAYWNYNQPAGDNFPIRSGRGYIVRMRRDKLHWFPGKKL